MTSDTNCYVSAISDSLGELVPADKFSELAADKDALVKLQKQGLTHVSQLRGDVRSHIVKAGTEALHKSGRKDDVDTVVFCGEFHFVQATQRKYLQSILDDLGLPGCERLVVSGGGNADVYSGLNVAMEKVEAGKSRRVLILSVYCHKEGTPRVIADGNVVLCDGVVGFVVSSEAEGGFRIANSLTVTHDDWTKPGALGSRANQREYVTVMSRVADTLLDGELDVESMQDAVAGVCATPIPLALLEASGVGALNMHNENSNFVVSGGQLVVADRLAEMDAVKKGAGVLIHSITPHAYHGLVLERV